jgi:hypothetical protein
MPMLLCEPGEAPGEPLDGRYEWMLECEKVRTDKDFNNSSRQRLAAPC